MRVWTFACHDFAPATGLADFVFRSFKLCDLIENPYRKDGTPRKTFATKLSGQIAPGVPLTTMLDREEYIAELQKQKK